MKKDLIEATLRLFNAIQISDSEKSKNNNIFYKRTIRNGYIIDPKISINYDLLDTIEAIIGISGEKANSSFHKSWEKVQNSSIEDLVVEQMLHYATTYGFEELDAFNDEFIYIPNEVLEIPDGNIKLTFVKGINKEEIFEKIIHLDGIALSEESLDDIMCIIKNNNYDSEFVHKIKNKELKSRLFDFYNIVPKDPEEFLRYLISKLTNESLLIKNDYLISKIKQSNGKFLDILLKDSPDNLATIFYRFKPLFLAMKCISENKIFFNQLRKKAKKMHKPMPKDYINSVTSNIKDNTFDIFIFQTELENINIFRKIKLAYALKNRINHSSSILYKVRNGSGWITDFDDSYDWSYSIVAKLALKLVLKSISRDIGKNVQGETIYIPKNVHYTLPSTEKQFTGNFPIGSYFEVDEDMIIGINWFDTEGRVDLDLAMIGVSGKTGWDECYRSDENKILFSGDVTAAPEPNGATELFYIKSGVDESKIMTLNFYNYYNGSKKVPCKIILAKEKPESFGQNYMVDQKNIVATTNINISKKSYVIGLLASIENKTRFYFSCTRADNSISSEYNDKSQKIRKFFENTLINSITLKEVLIDAGANVVDNVENVKNFNDIVDLSPESLDKNTIINLIK